MFNRSKVIVSLTLTGLFMLAAPARAATVEESGVAEEVNACIAKVRERMDYRDAARVRHDVTAIERRTVGYTLRISTTVYGENERDAIRAYAATCVVNGDNPPLSFDMAEGA